MQTIKNWWNGLSADTRDHIISAGRVFVSTFVAVAGAAISAVGLNNLSGHLILAALTAGIGAALSAVLKYLIQEYAPPTLGGKRKTS